jgi:hypothetical protein
MPATINQIATALATQLATIPGLRTYAYQPDQLNPPIAFPILQTVNYHKAFGGGDVTTDWNITVVAGRYTDRTAHSLLDSYLSYSGASSIRLALESNPTLSGVVATLVLSSAANISAVTVGDAEFLQISMQCQVHG